VLHKIFDAGRVDIEIKDRFGNPVEPKEWFLVPLRDPNYRRQQCCHRNAADPRKQSP
jgi:hypothetical protein